MRNRRRDSEISLRGATQKNVKTSEKRPKGEGNKSTIQNVNVEYFKMRGGARFSDLSQIYMTENTLILMIFG